MLKRAGQIAFRLMVFGVTALVVACNSGNRMHTPVAPAHQADVVIEDDLKPTSPVDDTSDGPIVKDGITYEPPPKTIQNPQAPVLLGRVKLEKARISYDSNLHKLRVTGFARIFDDHKNELIRAAFDIIGTQNPDDPKVTLRDDKDSTTTLNSNESPIIRATATCLSVNSQGETDCAHAVIDFFIAYKKQVLSEQMELAPKVAPSVTTPAPAPAPEKEDQASAPDTSNTSADTNKDDDDMQTEGKDNSLDGRYQGQAETEDLKEIFSDDAAADELIPPAPAPNLAPTPAPTPAPAPKPVTPAPTTPPTAPSKTPPPPGPAPAPVSPTENESPKPSEKKEKYLSKDMLQLKNGDVRPVEQALGYADKGSIRNATSALTKQQTLNLGAFFEVAAPQRNRYYGTYEMIEMIARLGKFINTISNHKLYVSDISQKNGGVIYSVKNGKSVAAHDSHQAGVDADLGYPALNESIKFPVVATMKPHQFHAGVYSPEKTYELVKYAFLQTDIVVDRIFMDELIKKNLCDYAKSKNIFNSADKDVATKLFNNIQHVDGHGDHFHLRVKCSVYDHGCRNKLYAVNKGCD